MQGTATDSERLGDGASSPVDHNHEMPLAGYSVLSATFVAGFVGSVVAAKRVRGGLPQRYSPWDLITAGTASYNIIVQFTMLYNFFY